MAVITAAKLLHAQALHAMEFIIGIIAVPAAMPRRAMPWPVRSTSPRPCPASRCRWALLHTRCQSLPPYWLCLHCA